MSTATPPRLLTAEELMQLPDPPDGSQQELVRGEVITMPPPSFYHGLVCNLFTRHVGNFVADRQLGWVVCNDSGVILERDPDTVRGPDVAFWSLQRLPVVPRSGYPEVTPDLVVEVMSPGDVYTRVAAKVQQYVDAGVELIWVAVPEDQAIAVHRLGRPVRVLTIADTITGDDVLPGFTCPVAHIFP